MTWARFFKFSIVGVYNVVLIFAFLEVLLRLFPNLIPFGHTWNYIHHYLGVSRFLENPDKLAWNGYPAIAIGDSFTRGAEVPPNSDWPALLNKNYGHRIFNLGIGGASTVEELTVLQNIQFPRSIETVVLGIFHNDIIENVDQLRRLTEEGPQPFLNRSNRASDVSKYESCVAPWWSWIRKSKCVYLYSYAISTTVDIYRQFSLGDSYQKQVRDLTPYIYDDASRWYVPKTLNLAGYHSLDAYTRMHDEHIATTMALISVMNDYLAERNIKLIAVYFPAAHEVYAAEFGKLLNQQVSHLASFATLLQPHMAALNIPCLDITGQLRKVRLSEAPLYRRFDQHFSRSGHQAAARIIAPFVGRTIDSSGKDSQKPLLDFEAR